MDFLENCGLRPIYTNKEYMNSIKPKLKYHKFDMSKFNLIKEQHIDSSINKLKNININNKKNKQLISFTYIYDFILNNKENQYSVDINGFTSSESESDHDSDYDYYSN